MSAVISLLAASQNRTVATTLAFAAGFPSTDPELMRMTNINLSVAIDCEGSYIILFFCSFPSNLLLSVDLLF